MMTPPVDLRSDTVTQPCDAMKRAMVEAPLGDDVLGDDPTIHRLEAQCAERAGKEAAIFVPSGTMANLLAIRCQTRLGDEVLVHEDSHPYNYEAAGSAAFAGVQLRALRGPLGQLNPRDVAAAVRAQDPHFPPAALLCAEDTSNRGGGAVYPLPLLDELGSLARDKGLASHLDGARVFNAVVASGIPLARRVAAWDTVSFCFSKGLGAPVGSVLVGPAGPIHLALRMRKLLGGGMRQAGMLAAAAIYALDHHVERLASDHRRATALAEGLRRAGFEVQSPETNMVYVSIDGAEAWQDALDAQGIRCFAIDPGRLRLVLHLHIDDGDVQRTIETFERVRDRRSKVSSA